MTNLEKLLAQPKITHDLVQGSDEWHRFRLEHDGASEAAAMLGLSRKTKRSELLRAKHTGIPREFSAWVQENILDYGHEVEAMARPILEEKIGTDLYPVTCSRGKVSASCDGLDLNDRTAFEHKQWNEDLASMVAAGVVPDEHMPQCQQILMVTGAELLYFVVSDGTPEKMVWATVTPDRVWWERLADGWAQFDRDLADYQLPAAPAPAVVAAPVQALPAVVVQVSGSIAVTDNFQAFKVALTDFLEHRLIRQPKTDQDFANLDVQIKAMKGAEAALESAEAQMLAQVEPIYSAKATKDMLAKLVRDNRLMAEKLLASEKERRRGEIVAAGVTALREHIAALNERLGRAYMPNIPADFGGAIKGMRSLDSMDNAVATELARAKIEAHRVADTIAVNLAHLAKHANHSHLFADERFLVLKAPEDFAAVVAQRIAAHRAAEERRAAELAEKERERIRREEAARADEEARQRAAAAAPAPSPAPVAPVATAPALTADLTEEHYTRAVALVRENQRASISLVQRHLAIGYNAAASLLERMEREGIVSAMGPTGVRTLISAAPAQVGVPMPTGRTVRLGELNVLIAPLSITADGLAKLGFQPTGKDRAAILFDAAQVPAMLAAMQHHLQGVAGQREDA